MSEPAVRRRRNEGESNGAPGRSRTCDPRFRKPVLYPAELRAREAELNSNADGTRSGTSWASRTIRCPILSNMSLWRHAKPQIRLILVMRSATELQIASRCLSARREGHEVVILEKSGFRASSLSPVESAAPAITLPHVSFHGCRHATRPFLN